MKSPLTKDQPASLPTPWIHTELPGPRGKLLIANDERFTSPSYPRVYPLAVERGLLKFVPDEFRLHAHHWLILLGRYTCKARTPECSQCTIRDLCEYRRKTPDVTSIDAKSTAAVKRVGVLAPKRIATTPPRKRPRKSVR